MRRSGVRFISPAPNNKSQPLWVGFLFCAKPQTTRACGRFCLRFRVRSNGHFCPGSTHFCSLFSKNVENLCSLAQAQTQYPCWFAPASKRAVRRHDRLPKSALRVENQMFGGASHDDQETLLEEPIVLVLEDTRRRVSHEACLLSGCATEQNLIQSDSQSLGDLHEVSQPTLFPMISHALRRMLGSSG